jgi:hypothetical protein
MKGGISLDSDMDTEMVSRRRESFLTPLDKEFISLMKGMAILRKY